MTIDLTILKDIVSERFKINIAKRSREIQYIKASAIFSELAYKYTNKSYHDIGKVLGNRSHATILHARKTFKSFNDEMFFKDYEHIKKVLHSIFKDENTVSLDSNLEDEIKELKNKLTILKIELINAKELIKTGTTKYKEINELLKLEDEQIQFACETRLKPFLKMQESKITNKDLIQKQYETRTL